MLISAIWNYYILDYTYPVCFFTVKHLRGNQVETKIMLRHATLVFQFNFTVRFVVACGLGDVK